MIVIAVLNGTARDLLYKQYVGELTGWQISTISLIILFGIYIGLLLKKYPIRSEIQAVSVGALWLILTLAFNLVLAGLEGIHGHICLMNTT